MQIANMISRAKDDCFLSKTTTPRRRKYIPIESKVNLKRDKIAKEIPDINTEGREGLFIDFSNVHKERNRNGIYIISVDVAQKSTSEGIRV